MSFQQGPLSRLRRFGHKIEFRFLTPEGNVTFYRKMLAGLVNKRLDKQTEARIRSLSKLAPGDFKVVRDRCRFKAQQEVTHDLLVEALKEEVKAKAIHAGEKAIGF
jgi:transitional endoplasmic reticulum ATPase